jgi:hypothetical protein
MFKFPAWDDLARRQEGLDFGHAVIDVPISGKEFAADAS